jgi:hypothetical protein
VAGSLVPESGAIIARVTLAHRGMLNAIDVAMAQALHAQFEGGRFASDGPDATEQNAPVGYADNTEHREGDTAFFEKRAPRFERG